MIRRQLGFVLADTVVLWTENGKLFKDSIQLLKKLAVFIGDISMERCCESNLPFKKTTYGVSQVHFIRL